MLNEWFAEIAHGRTKHLFPVAQHFATLPRTLCAAVAPRGGNFYNKCLTQRHTRSPLARQLLDHAQGIASGGRCPHVRPALAKKPLPRSVLVPVNHFRSRPQARLIVEKFHLHGTGTGTAPGAAQFMVLLLYLRSGEFSHFGNDEVLPKVHRRSWSNPSLWDFCVLFCLFFYDSARGRGFFLQNWDRRGRKNHTLEAYGRVCV